jgi:hypothetical protein
LNKAITVKLTRGAGDQTSEVVKSGADRTSLKPSRSSSVVEYRFWPRRARVAHYPSA